MPCNAPETWGLSLIKIAKQFFLSVGSQRMLLKGFDYE
jgi:hypothetical protein